MTNLKISVLTAMALVAVVPASAQTATLPCFVSQVAVNSRPEPSQVSGGPIYSLVVTGMPTYKSDCLNTSYESGTGNITFHPTIVIERRDAQTGSYSPVLSFAPAVLLDGNGKSRRSVIAETQMPKGSYRMRSFDKSDLIESLPFSVGSTAGDFAMALPFANAIPQDERFKVAFGQPSAIVRSGKLYFRAVFPEGKILPGYLFQDQADGSTSVAPVQFEQLLQSDGDYLANAMGFSGDSTWTRVNVSQIGLGTFDAGLPITGCIKSGAGTTCFSIFDPQVPFRDFNLNAAPFGANGR
jgi:hypothetical protein